jgi:serine/threonine protein kinase
MVADDRKQRPSAAAVWEETILMRSSRNESVHFCGACCMPIMSDSIPVPTSRPLALNYVSRSGGPDSKNSSLARDDETFSTQYWRTEEVPYVWGRNLRITNQAALDAVQPRNDNSWFCRKIVFPKNEESLEQRKAWEAARAEAELLKWLNTPVKHHHLVQLAGTYKQGRTSVLLIRPLAHFDLKTYLSWIEEPQVAHDHQTDSQKLLRNSFGCLASAVKHVHSKGIIHDDIQPQNILITIRDSPSVCLAEFGAAATKASKPLATYQASNTSEYEYKQKVCQVRQLSI